MNYSKKSIQKLGKRLRDGIEDSTDLEILKNYRNFFRAPLVELNADISAFVNNLNLNYVLAGRLKRIKSIIRKLRRPNSHNMDLSRMGDIAGTRIILGSITDQNYLIKKIQRNFEIEKIIDRRDGETNYRAVHVLIKNKQNIIIELQIRTILQQLWADESETYGEQAKQEKFVDMRTRQIEIYLKNLSHEVKQRELEINTNKITTDKDFIYKKKLPFEFKYKILLKSFDNVSSVKTHNNLFHILVFDTQTQELINHNIHSLNREERAVSEFNRINSNLNENRYDIVFINTNMGKEALKVTHPRFFI